MQQSCPISEPSVHKRGGHGSTWARHEKKEIWSQNLGPGPADQAGATGCADPEGWIACGLWSLCISRCRVGVELLKDFTEISWDGYLHRCSDITSGNLASHRKSRLQHGNRQPTFCWSWSKAQNQSKDRLEAICEFFKKNIHIQLKVYIN